MNFLLTNLLNKDLANILSNFLMKLTLVEEVGWGANPTQDICARQRTDEPSRGRVIFELLILI